MKRGKERNPNPDPNPNLVILHAVFQGLACFQLLLTPGGLVRILKEGKMLMAFKKC